MSLLERLARVIRTDADRVREARVAADRSEQILRHVERQEPEVRRHAAFARLVLEENHLAPKIRRALRESR